MVPWREKTGRDHIPRERRGSSSAVDGACPRPKTRSRLKRITAKMRGSIYWIPSVDLAFQPRPSLQFLLPHFFNAVLHVYLFLILGQIGWQIGFF
ncbi:unnamed protein product [Nezara viridula]|uniref:Uncharacterized protein n=1 Tax=Nezara viridula TaxID=85310 RepID=A0A9P0H3E0_NEZVI|nr:unnamed protein product [Nezara viridula]